MSEAAEVTFQVTMKDKEKDNWLEKGLRKQLLQAAVQHILKELTPEHLEAWAINLLDSTFKDIPIYELRKEIEAQALPYAKKLLAKPEMQDRIKKIVEDSIEEILKELPKEVRLVLTTRVANALRDSR